MLSERTQALRGNASRWGDARDVSWLHGSRARRALGTPLHTCGGRRPKARSGEECVPPSPRGSLHLQPHVGFRGGCRRWWALLPGARVML